MNGNLHSINDDRYSWILRQSRQYECLLLKSIDFGVRQKKIIDLYTLAINMA